MTVMVQEKKKRVAEVEIELLEQRIQRENTFL
jgi:hypothetical protein